MTRHPKLTLLSPRDFARRAAGFALFGVAFVLASLAIGIAGYHGIAHLGWIDSFFNASMILTGMGPVDAMSTDAAKIFASCYALFAGAVYPAVTALVLYPFLNHMLRALHIQTVEAVTAGQGQET